MSSRNATSRSRASTTNDDLTYQAMSNARSSTQITRAAGRAKTLLVSDYLKGVVTRHVVEALLAARADAAVPLVVDPKIPHLPAYAGATIVTPNHHEAEAATQRRILD